MGPTSSFTQSELARSRVGASVSVEFTERMGCGNGSKRVQIGPPISRGTPLYTPLTPGETEGTSDARSQGVPLSAQGRGLQCTIVQF